MKYILLIFFCLFIVSCGGTADEQANDDNPHHAAIPDSNVDMTSELSPEDREKLARAKGKQASSVDIKSLSQILKDSKSSAVLCYFWSIDAGVDRSALNQIAELSRNADERQLQVALVHLGPENHSEEVNAIIRESGVYADAYMIENALGLNKIQGNDANIKEELPYYYIYNAEEGTGMWQDGKVGIEELRAILQPFMM